MHVHDAWTLLIVDDGAVRYDLDRHEHGTPHDTVSLLPPHVPHNGSPATAHGFRKRVVYLDGTHLGEDLIGSAVDGPDLRDPVLRRRVGQLHTALGHPGDELEAESRLTLIAERLRTHLRPGASAATPRDSPTLARTLRELLDGHLTQGIGLDEAARLVHAHPAHLVRAFSGAYGIAPHQYLMSRRVDRARRLLLEGRPPGRGGVGDRLLRPVPSHPALQEVGRGDSGALRALQAGVTPVGAPHTLTVAFVGHDTLGRVRGPAGPRTDLRGRTTSVVPYSSRAGVQVAGEVGDVDLVELGHLVEADGGGVGRRTSRSS